MSSSFAGRAFLCWVAFLAATSWCGVALAEIERFSAGAALCAGALAALAAWLALPRAENAERVSGPQVAIVAGAALLLTATLLPTIDTTLLSQDASIHLASGRWLARSGSLAIRDPTLLGVSEANRLGLFELAAVGIKWASQSRLPGGLVVVDRLENVTYPSFAHLLSVWIAIASSAGGDRAIALLGPMFAFTAWWGLGLLALAQGSPAAAVATIALLASWLPEHWFGRFLMPEILTQALLWAGVAVAWRATARVEGAIAGACLGVAAFARLEQLTSFVPALLVARALLPTERRVLPRGALLPFALATLHAALHLWIIPTDYGKRMAKIFLVPLPWIWDALGATPHRVWPNLGLALIAAAGVGWVLHRWRKGVLTRLVAAAVGGAAFAWTLFGSPPESFPAPSWLWWYVPLPAWAAIASGLFPLSAPSGLGMALGLEAFDQIVNPRVTLEQIWATRRLVVVVLPLLALAAGWAIARRDRPRSRARAAIGVGLVAAALVLGGMRLAPVFGKRLQAGGAAFARQVGAAVPRGSTLILAQPLDWLHIAPSLWLESGLTPIVARSQQSFVAALDDYLGNHATGEVYVLAGVVTTGDGAVDPTAFRPPLPDGYTLEPVRTFTWSADVLERTTTAPPAALVKHRAEIALLRARREPR
jgi:hypothetical protein